MTPSVNTKSTNILVDYLIKRLKFEDQLSLDDFTDELPSNISPDIVGDLYHELLEQHQTKQLRVETHIESQFNMPIKGLLSEAAKNPDTMKRPKLASLVRELEVLKTRLKSHELDLNATTNRLLREIKEVVDILSSLEHDVDTEIIEDALQKMNKISTLLDISQGTI